MPNPLFIAIPAAAGGIGYYAYKSGAESDLKKLMGKDGMPKLPEDAVGEYGHIVARTHIEQIVTLGNKPTHGFNDFIEWGKKHNLSPEHLVKLSPVQTTKEVIEFALGGRMAQAGEIPPELAQAIAQAQAQPMVSVQVASADATNTNLPRDAVRSGNVIG